MDENKPTNKQTLSGEELKALLEPQALSLSNFKEALSGKTGLFKIYLFILTSTALSYLAMYNANMLERFLTYGWTQHYGDYRIHQIRFFIGFLMLVSFYIWILLRKRLETILLCYTGVLTYFLVSGTSRLILVLTLPNDSLFITVYVLIHSTFILMLLLMMREERRSKW